MRLSLLWCTVAILRSAGCARILAVLPVQARSHHVGFQAILKSLALRGHEVTVYSPTPLMNEEPIPNYTDVYIKIDYLVDKFMPLVINHSSIAFEKMVWYILGLNCEQAFESESLKKLITSNETFDVVFISALLSQEAMVVFGHKFRAPVITIDTRVASTVDLQVFGSPLSISYIPDIALPYSTSMSFLQRIVNAYSKLLTIYSYHTYHLPSQEALMKRHFHDPTLPPLVDMVYNISLTFTMGHKTAFYAQPTTPNIIPVGGIHIQPDRKPLPKDIKKFMDEATEGVIYFSLGTYIKPDGDSGEEYIQMYINAFKNLPQRILWKTNLENLQIFPENIMTATWFPQQDVLAYRNMVLFITHGGIQCLHETLYFGVPVLGVPYMSDQPMNIAYCVESGLGLRLDPRTVTEQQIHEAITTIIGDPKYADNAKRMSRIYRDVDISGAESVVYWTEYVLNHGGAPQLRPASTRLSWYQLLLLDVLAVILVAIFMLLTLFYLVISRTYRVIVKPERPTINKLKAS